MAAFPAQRTCISRRAQRTCVSPGADRRAWPSPVADGVFSATKLSVPRCRGITNGGTVYPGSCSASLPSAYVLSTWRQLRDGVHEVASARSLELFIRTAIVRSTREGSSDRQSKHTSCSGWFCTMSRMDPIVVVFTPAPTPTVTPVLNVGIVIDVLACPQGIKQHIAKRTAIGFAVSFLPR